VFNPTIALRESVDSLGAVKRKAAAFFAPDDGCGGPQKRDGDGHMDPCEAYENWEDGDRFEMLKELILDALDVWGFDDVDVVNSDVDGAPAEYDSNIIYLDMDNEAFGDAQDAMSVAYHETMHAMLDQAGIDIEGLQEEMEAGFLGSRAAGAFGRLVTLAPLEPFVGGGSAPPFPWRCDLDDGF
jgi:hypothetical protein